MNIEHELRMIQVHVRDHRAETQAQARELRKDLAELGAAMRVELVERVPAVRGEVEAWLAGYELELVGL